MSAARRLEELDPRWRARAACKGKTEIFLPAEHEREIDRSFREARAKSICRQCPVIDDCRVWARENREPFVAGGESAADRKAAGFKPRANGEHFDRDAERARRLQAEQELAAIYMGNVPLEALEQIAALARALDPTKETRE